MQLILALLALWGIVCHSYVLSQSSVTACKKTSSALVCKVELLINVALSPGVEGTDTIEIKDLKLNDGNVMKLEKPISVAASLGDVFVRYSVSYLADVNSQPQEHVGVTSLLSCVGDQSKILSDANCGQLKRPDGGVIADSEGFCCPCSFDQMLGLGSNHRGGLQCSLLSAFENGATVHCLRWGPIWYSVFRIAPPTIEYSVRVVRSKMNGDGKPGEGSSATPLSDAKSAPDLGAPESLELASNAATVLTREFPDGLKLSARIVGALSPTRAPPDIGNQFYAAAPNVMASSTSSDERIMQTSPTDPFKYGLLLSHTELDLTGRACSKAGVSYHGFKFGSGNRCQGTPGDCLFNQIESIWTSPEQRKVALIPDNLCVAVNGRFVHDDGHRLSCVLGGTSGQGSAQVLLTLNAEEVAFVFNCAKGKISSVNVVRLTDSTDALGRHPVRLDVLVANEDTIDGSFAISVGGCRLVHEGLPGPAGPTTEPGAHDKGESGGQAGSGSPVPDDKGPHKGTVPTAPVVPSNPASTSPSAADTSPFGTVGSGSLSVKAQESKMVPVLVSDRAWNSGNYTCDVTLADMYTGDVLDVKTVRIDYTGVQVERHAQAGESPGAPSADAIVRAGRDRCSTLCGSFFAIACFLAHDCWWDAAKGLAAIAGMGVALSLLFKFGVFRMIMGALPCCGSGSRKSRSDDGDYRRNRDDRRERDDSLDRDYHRDREDRRGASVSSERRRYRQVSPKRPVESNRSRSTVDDDDSNASSVGRHSPANYYSRPCYCPDCTGAGRPVTLTASSDAGALRQPRADINRFDDYLSGAYSSRGGLVRGPVPSMRFGRPLTWRRGSDL